MLNELERNFTTSLTTVLYLLNEPFVLHTKFLQTAFTYVLLPIVEKKFSLLGELNFFKKCLSKMPDYKKSFINSTQFQHEKNSRSFKRSHHFI